VIKDIRRATRRQFSAEEKIRIVLDGLRGECQRAPKSPQLWAFKIPYPAGSVAIGDQPGI